MEVTRPTDFLTAQSESSPHRRGRRHPTKQQPQQQQPHPDRESDDDAGPPDTDILIPSRTRSFTRQVSWDGSSPLPSPSGQDWTEKDFYEQKISMLQSIVADLTARLNEADATVHRYLATEYSVAQYERLETRFSVTQQERDSYKEQVVVLQELLKERDKELTSFHMNSLDSLGERYQNTKGSSYSDHPNNSHDTAATVRQLQGERETALLRAGEMAHQLAQAMAEADDAQERLNECVKLLNHTQDELSVAQRKLARYEASESSSGTRGFIMRTFSGASTLSEMRRRSLSSVPATTAISEATTATAGGSVENGGKTTAVQDSSQSNGTANESHPTTVHDLQVQLQQVQDEKNVYVTLLKETQQQLAELTLKVNNQNNHAINSDAHIVPDDAAFLDAELAAQIERL